MSINEEMPSLETRQANLKKLILDNIDEAGINQNTLAKRVGVRPTTISAWVNGVQFPDELNRKKLAQAMGYTIDRLEAKINGTRFEPPKTAANDVIDFLRFCTDAQFLNVWVEAIAPRVSKAFSPIK